jgi:tellurite resistance protein
MEVFIALALFVFVIWLVVRSQSRDTKSLPAGASSRSQAAATPPPTHPKLASPSQPAVVKDYWVPSGREVAIAGYRIPGGMIYVGKGLCGVAGYGAEPALIDPSFPVSRDHPDRAGAGMNYWPSYDSIHPSCRAAYLEWLAGGRRDPSAQIGYVFLFFYGLERRALADSQRLPHAKQDLPAIAREVEELLHVYGPTSGSFLGYASRFLDVLKLLRSDYQEPQPPTERQGYELPLSVRLAIGRIIMERKPLPAEWALSWFLTHPETWLRASARRCPEEFQKLFAARYKEAFGGGLVLAADGPKLKFAFRPASASFTGQVEVATNVPDITIETSTLSKLRELGERCEADLDAYSRWIGRNPSAPKTIAAVALLPAEIVKGGDSQEARELWNFIEMTLGPQGRAVCPTDSVLRHCASLGSGKLAKSEAVLLAQLLQKGKYGIEPDVRFGGAPLTPGGVAVLFRLPPDAPEIASPGYVATTMLLDLAVAVSAADGTISSSEQEQLQNHLRESPELSEAERLRLSVHLTWLMRAQPAFTSLRKRLQALDVQVRQDMAKFIASVACADGVILPEEILTLRKIYPMLGFAADDVYTHLHAMASRAGIGSDETSAGSAGSGLPSHGLPTAGAVIPGAVRLDMVAVKRKFTESARISAILNDIFSDEEPRKEMRAVNPASIPGKLSPMYGALLSDLLKQPEWPRSDFERVAAEYNLLPDGAIDTLNEAAIEIAGAPVIEGDDPMEINTETAKELLV